jgi:hypothetical protein
MEIIESLLRQLPKHIENEKGTKFNLTICTTSKGNWRICYVWAPRAIKRKGWPAYEHSHLLGCLTLMRDFISTNHPKLLTNT